MKNNIEDRELADQLKKIQETRKQIRHQIARVQARQQDRMDKVDNANSQRG